MKKALSIFLMAIMLVSCFTFSVSAEESTASTASTAASTASTAAASTEASASETETPASETETPASTEAPAPKTVNYALEATYVAESTVGENIYSLSDNRGNDSANTRLNDGKTAAAEDPSICASYTGTKSTITITFDLKSFKSDINTIKLLNVTDEYGKEISAGTAAPDSNAFTRGFLQDAFKLSFAGEDKKFTKTTDYTMSVVGHDGNTDMATAIQRDYSYALNAPAAARYVQIEISSPAYVLSLDEIQIIGSGAEAPATQPTTTASANASSNNTGNTTGATIAPTSPSATTPNTADSGKATFVLVALLSLVSLAGAVVATKKRA